MTADMPDSGVIRDAVELASRAPSLHNSQPWRWVADGAMLQLWADPRISMPASDYSGRETLLSCGAVLDHMRLAMAVAGWDSSIERLAEPDNPELLATLRFRSIETVPPADQRCADAIARRRTDRLPYAAPPRWAALRSALQQVAETHGVLLDEVADDDRQQLAEVSRLTEQLRQYDTAYMTELRWWTSPFESDSTHVPDSALVSSSEAARVDVARAFPPAGGGRRRADLDHDESKIVVLSTGDDDAVQLLRCGEALSAVLLECTGAGMATCTLTHMTELEESRQVVAKITGNGRPQLLIRVGRSPTHEHRVERTARRAVAEILEFRD